MKNILYSILAIFILNNAAIAQLMSDEQHRAMMNTYSSTLNSILSSTCPTGMTIDQYKRRLITGEVPPLLSSNQLNIISAAEPLKIYGAQFAAAKGLAVINDNYKYFYAAFAPSTSISGGKLIESSTIVGITAVEMWQSASNSFTTADCGSSVLVTDKNNLYTLATTCVNKVGNGIVSAGVPGILLMTNGFSNSLYKWLSFENVAFAMSSDTSHSNLTANINNFLNQNIVNQERIDELAGKVTLTTAEMEEFANDLGFQTSESMITFHDSIMNDLVFLYNNYLKPTSNIPSEQANILNISDRYISNSSSKLATGLYFNNILVNNIKNINSVVQSTNKTHPAVCKATYAATMYSLTEQMIEGNMACAEMDFVPQVGLTCHGLVTGVYLVGVAHAAYGYRECLKG